MRPFLWLFCLFLLTAAPLPAVALSASEKSAFQFAEKKDWDNARQHAQKSGNPTLIRLMQWQYLIDPDSGATFEEITGFMSKHPDWPDQKRLQLRAEQSLRNDMPADGILKHWLDQHPPLTGWGKWALAEILLKQNAQSPEADTLLHEAWHGGDFDEGHEVEFLERHGGRLKAEDHHQRIDRLLWEGKTNAAQRILMFVDNAHQVLYRARMELIDDNRQALSLVAEVPAPLSSNTGLLFDRMQWHARKGDTDIVREMLRNTPAQVPYPEKWWRTRELQVRKAIDEKKYKLAEKLLSNHGQNDGQEFADATWLSGWIALRFHKNPQAAYQLFYRMHDNVKFPVSRARAAYWAGRAAEAANDSAAAQRWYQEAAEHLTTFYGQLARLKLGQKQALHLPAKPHIDEQARADFMNRSVVQAAKLAMQADANETANAFINHLIDNAGSPQEMALTAEIGKAASKTVFTVRAAKRALQRGEVLGNIGYPVIDLPADLALEKPFALAIARQESEFDPRAQSPSGALGLMQLLPGTAKETAKRNDLPYAKARLYESKYNLTLGSLYLARLVNAFDNSYVMAAAAYNAGPGRLRSWRWQFGDPEGSIEDVVDWIEKIPYAETRNYVQRVMENMQIYRALITADATLSLEDDLTR